MAIKNIPWDEISAKLKNEATDDQLRVIQEWLDASADHPAILNEIVNTWMLTRNTSKFYQPDLELNWKELTSRIAYSEKRKVSRNLFARWIAAAAVLVLVFLAGVGLENQFGIHHDTVSYTRIIAPKGNKTQIVLPDSTHVWLNSGSEIQYASDYTAKNRKVSMKGECFFKVTKDPLHPFTVRCSDFQVRVLGTQFNVNENEAKESAAVTLVSGKVQIMNLSDMPVAMLKPGQQFIYTGGEGQVQQAKNIEALTAWVNNMLIFNNQPFESIVPYLEKWYGVKIHLDQSLYQTHNYTFKVKTESLREVLELISVITPIDYQIAGEQVTIKYKKR